MIEQSLVSQVWLIESLVELRGYAAQSGLPELAKHLDVAVQLAHLEIAMREGRDGARPTDANDGGSQQR